MEKTLLDHGIENQSLVAKRDRLIDPTSATKTLINESVHNIRTLRCVRQKILIYIRDMRFFLCRKP